MLSGLTIAVARSVNFFFFPVVLLLGVLAGLGVIMVLLRKRKPPLPPSPISDEERADRCRQQKDRLAGERSRILEMIANGQVTAEEGDRLLDAIERETSTMACPFCEEDIRIEAVKCKFCGRFLVDSVHHGPRRLYLSREPVIDGVCGGIADYLGMDPTLVRILTIVVALFTSIIPLLIAYVVAAWIMPRRP